MAGGEKKGLFGKLFRRKDQTEEPKREKREVKPPRAAADAPAEAAEESLQKDLRDDVKISDAVELELDIPEHEISTVALSVEDLDVNLLSGKHFVETPPPSVKEAVSEGPPSDGSESETIDTTTEIKLEASQVRAAQEKLKATDEPAPEIPADEEAARALDDRQEPSKDFRTDVSSVDDDDFEIELDEGGEEPRVIIPRESSTSASAEPSAKEAEPEPPTTEAEQELSSATEEEAEAVTSGRVAMHYGFPEYVEAEVADTGEATAPGLVEAAPEEAAKAEPRMGPTALSDVPLSEELLSEMTPGMIARSEALAQVVETCQTPMRIQISGDAGSGKTSLLNAVQARLTARVLPLWLRAGDYARFESPGSLFLEDFLANLEKRIAAADTDFTESIQRARHHLRLLTHAKSWFTDSEVGSSGREQPTAGPEALTASELSSEVAGLVDRGLQLAAAEKLCVFVDDVHRLDAATSVEIMEAALRFLDLENCVIVAACDSQTLSRGAAKRCSGEAVADSLPGLERIFQLSVNVASDYGAMGVRLPRLLRTVELPYSEEDLDDYLRLQRYSIGPNPRREKLVINRLMILSKLCPNVWGAEDGDSETSLNRKLLFGLVCLEMAFPRAFRLLVSALPQERDLSLLLHERLRDREEVLSLDQEFSLFRKDSDREDRSQRLIAFLDTLVDILLNRDRNRRPDAQSTHTLSNLVRIVATEGTSAADWYEDDARSAVLTEFCRRVVDHVQRSLGKGAPDVLDRRIRIQSSGSAWFSLRYSADTAKAAWGPGRLFYELSFSPENVASVGLKCDTVRALELGASRETIKGLSHLPLVQEGRFRFKDHGAGWVEIVTVLHVCSCHSGSEPADHEVESVASALQELVIGTRDLFNLPIGVVTAAPEEPPQVQCKVCKNPLEPVILKDGSQAYKCGTCRKVYKAKPVAKPAG